MPRPSLGPRLWFNPGRQKWVIRDGSIFISTGCEGWKGAQERFNQYMNTREPADRVRVQLPTKGFVYFVTADSPDFPIKIGFTQKLNGIRIESLQTGCPYEIILLATVPGVYSDERNLHRRFGGQRLKGEWFARSVDLMAYIEGLRRDAA